MLSLEQTKKLFNEPNMSDTEAERIRSRSYAWADLLIDRWLASRSKIKVIENKDKNYERQPKEN